MPTSLIDEIQFDGQGLIPAVAQQHDSGEVLMLAWMNRDAVLETLATGRVCYWSRSRGALWRKGETSGQVQALVEMRVDCHTGRRSCFYRAVRDGALVVVAEPVVTHEELYG